MNLDKVGVKGWAKLGSKAGPAFEGKIGRIEEVIELDSGSKLYKVFVQEVGANVNVREDGLC